MFIEGPEAHQPPYLSNFQGTAGERHVENLKVREQCILRKLSLTLVRRFFVRWDAMHTEPPLKGIAMLEHSLRLKRSVRNWQDRMRIGLGWTTADPEPPDGVTFGVYRFHRVL